DRIHDAGIIHRDLKPENLFLARREDGSIRLKVLDFGVAKVADHGGAMGTASSLVGTPLYKAPEQIPGGRPVTPGAAVYARAQIAYRMLVGGAYWEDEKQAAENLYALLMQIAAGPPETASARAARRRVLLPAAFDAWFAQATATDPDERHPRA